MTLYQCLGWPALSLNQPKEKPVVVPGEAPVETREEENTVTPNNKEKGKEHV